MRLREAFTIKRDSDGYEFERDLYSMESIADSHGCDLIVREENQLLIDMDDRDVDTATLIIERQLSILQCAPSSKGECKVEIYASRGGNGAHAILTFSEMTFDNRQAAAMEAVFGGDIKRAMLNIVRADESGIVHSCLFRPRVPVAEADDQS